jgi:glycosyltransferase involved in cell wall biosynthesis
MKIVMIARSTLYSSPGGDTTQILMTAKYLQELGVEVEIRLSNEDVNYSAFDLIHFFNIIRPDDILPHVHKSDTPFVISTIFVDYYEYEQKNRKGILSLVNSTFDRDQIEYLKSVARSVKNNEKIKSRYYLLKGHKKSVQYLAENAAVLLPNSHSEYNRFVAQYGVKQRYQKVVNAIDPKYFCNTILPDPEFKDYVLCVGRIEGRKNQLNLIKAILETDLNLAIIGKPSPNHLGYYQQCLDLAKDTNKIKFIEHIDHQGLSKIYKAAKVHVLPSWFETTGLSSLEAGAMDCNIVITDKGDTKEYFDDKAYYCSPDDVASIRKAVLQAYHEPVNPQLKEYILRYYTWVQTAEQTLSSYKKILNK